MISLPLARITSYIFGKKAVILDFDVEKPDFFSQDIASNVDISPAWSEFPLEPALNVHKTRQSIQIFIEGYEKLFHDHMMAGRQPGTAPFFHAPVLPNGQALDLKVQLIDENEEAHELEFTWLAYCLGFTKKLPPDRKFIRLRISGNVPFKAEKIRWFDIGDNGN